MKANAKDPAVTVRFPQRSLLDRLSKAARSNGRSRNTEIVVRLERTLAEDRLKKSA